ncbi:hypothetical protein QBC40DRAFT_347439 [Triangularia verruculosa]|uniref:Uncharacterized protein n=1 Tax=Triangularia verruculosa TaxID=2587418 RepID=A0AAN6XNV5_9PEZI|nr:hypothetical protein QBC40DRAFT_347439 [Triangularia verruculosa]
MEFFDDDLFGGQDDWDSIYPPIVSPTTTPQPTLTLPQAPQKPPTPAQQEPYTFGSSNNTGSYNAAQQLWASIDTNSYLDASQTQTYPTLTQDQLTETSNHILSVPAQGLTAQSQNQRPASGPTGETKPRTLSQKFLHGKKIIHGRTQRYNNENPALIYDPAPAVKAWGPLLKNTRVPEHTFEYVKSHVELVPPKRFSQDELVTFLKGTGCPQVPRKLTVWVQNTPSQVNHRYAMSGSSGKCRYDHCPGKFTIWKGFFRVAFDEYSDKTGISLDPFHNAGYMHLHCFEKLFDLGYLVHYGAAQWGFSVRQDVRSFPMEDKNPMSLVHNNRHMANAYEQWVEEQKPRCQMLFVNSRATYDPFHLRTPPPHKKTLGYKLTTCNLDHEVGVRSTIREDRGGAHIGIHKGNLEHFMAIKARMRNANNQAYNKRRSRDDDDEVEQQQDTISYKPRPTKRARTPRVPSINTSVNNSISDPIIVDEPNFFPFLNGMDLDLMMMDCPTDLGSFPITNQQQVFVPPQLTSAIQSPRPRTRQRSREMSVSLVGFLNSRNTLTLTQAQEIGARLAEEPTHVQDSVLSAVQPEMANMLLRDGISPVVESKIKKLNKRQLKDLETVIERVEKSGDMKRASSMW